MPAPRPQLLGCLLGCLLALASCGPSAVDDQAPSGLQREVLTAFQPARWMAERLLDGASVPVVCLLPADADAVHWRPSRDELRRMQRARLVVLHGAGLESWVDVANLPASRSVDLSAGLAEAFLERAGEGTHSHGMTGAHSHAGLDPHLWLEPGLALRQAQALHAALARGFPEHAARLDANLAALRADLTALAEGWAARAPALRAACLVAAHPAYDYLAAAHGFDITSLDLDPTSTSPEQAVQALSALGATPGCLVLWESAPREDVAAALDRQLGVRSVVVDPGEGCRPGDPRDVLEAWRANLTRLDPLLPEIP